MKTQTFFSTRMKTCLQFFVVISMITATAPMTIANETAENTVEISEDSDVNQPANYFVKLLGTRDDWPNNMTQTEQQVMEDHFAYLDRLTRQGKVLLAGPNFDPVFGMVILKADTESEAREIMDADPSVLAGVHTYEMHPMHVSLLARQDDANRYVARPSKRILTKEVIVNCSLDKAWHAWTTSDGITNFFVPEAIVQLRPCGKYELVIVPTSPEGQRGSEDCRVLSFLPESMLSFEWSAPPQFGELRDKRTIVVLTFDEFGPGQIRVTLNQHGWGRGEEWDRLYDYFDRAWSSVLSAFKKYAESDEN
ncbi:hypothetical protein GF356_12245 [candidate division GN15 bacterium]|nr:hypothetical protein [candidate division GN15 bacterium]